MPALPAVPKVVRVVCKQTLQDDLDVINRFYLQYSGTAPTATQLNTFANAVATQWGANVSPLQISNAVLVLVSVEDLSSATGAVGSFTANVPGTRAGSTLSASVCGVILETIARRYRGGHPKVFLWSGAETDIQTVGTWKAAFTTALASGWAAFITGVATAVWTGGGTLTAVNVSYYSGFTNFTYPSGRTRPRPTLRVSPLVDAITGYVGRTIIGSQRRRNQ